MDPSLILGGISTGLSLLGPLFNIKGPRQKRREAQQRQEQQRQQQASQFAAIKQAQAPSNPGETAGGGSLPLPSPPVGQPVPTTLPQPPQMQLQAPNGLQTQRNDYLMKLLMQGNR